MEQLHCGSCLMFRASCRKCREIATAQEGMVSRERASCGVYHGPRRCDGDLDLQDVLLASSSEG